jgi:hypothetical protein
LGAKARRNEEQKKSEQASEKLPSIPNSCVLISACLLKCFREKVSLSLKFELQENI